MFLLVDKSSGYLFSSSDLREIIEHQHNVLRSEVEQMDGNRLLNTAPADLVRYLVDKYTVEAPVLRRDAWSVSERETQIDVRHDQSLIPGQCIEIEVPVDGEIQLLYARASTFSSMPPRAEVQGSPIQKRGATNRNRR